MATAVTLAVVDWTPVFVAGVTSFCAAVPATIAAIASIRGRRETRDNLNTPSGETVGTMVERTNHLAEVNAAHIVQVQKRMDEPRDKCPTTSPPP